MITFLKVIHTKPEQEVPSDLTQYILDLQISKGTEAKKNTASFTLINLAKDLNNINFDVDDSISVWLDKVPITTQDPIIIATIQSVEYPVDNGKPLIKIKSADKTFLLLSKLWSFAYIPSDNKKANEVIIDIIRHTTETAELGSQITYNNVASTKSNGSAFDINVSIAKLFKPLYEWIMDLSNPEFTGEDRSYVFYIDNNNDLHWNYPFQKPDTFLTSAIDESVTTIPVSSTSDYADSGTILIDYEAITYTGKTSNTFTGCTRGAFLTSAMPHSIGATVQGQVVREGRDDVYKISLEESAEGSFNFIIYNAGPTPGGYDYLWYKFNEASAEKEFKMKFMDWKDIGKQLRDREKVRTDWTDKESDYPPSYPWTPFWSVSSVANDAQYLDSFITEQEKQADNRAITMFRVGQVKWKGSAEMKGTLRFEINDLVTVQSDAQGIIRKLRIKDIKQQITQQGWFTTLEFETDESAVGVEE